MWNALDDSRVCYVEMLDGMSYGNELSILDVISGEVLKLPWGITDVLDRREPILIFWAEELFTFSWIISWKY